jgi:hypothetical protein
MTTETYVQSELQRNELPYFKQILFNLIDGMNHFVP